MTGNVAQVFVTDESWRANLAGIAAALRAGGWLVFEVRDPARRAWEGWTPAETYQRVEIDGVGVVESWQELLDVDDEVVTFRSMTVLPSGPVESTSTLRFRSRAAVEASLVEAGLGVTEVRDAPDRPGCEHVFLARRSGLGRRSHR